MPRVGAPRERYNARNPAAGRPAVPAEQAVPYFIRVLTPSVDRVPIAILERALVRAGARARVRLGSGTAEEWDSVLLSHDDGAGIGLVERSSVPEGAPSREAMAPFVSQLARSQPTRAAEWLATYLPSVRTVYALQVLAGVDRAGGWDALHVVQGAIWVAAGGIVQSDGEGFSNEDGHCILWQFDDDVSGLWKMAVRDTDGTWTSFEMERGDKAQRRAFLQGRMPAGARVL